MNEKLQKVSMKAAAKSANEIAELFSIGFFDDQMVDVISKIIYENNKQILQKCIKEEEK